MEKKKIFKFCTKYPIIALPHHSAGELAYNAFNLEKDVDYIESRTIEDRHGIKKVKKYQELKNRIVPLFEQHGNNEKYLLNAFFYSKASILYMLGGVGTGKSSFLKYFSNEIFPNRNHICKKPCANKLGNVIFIDFEKDSYPSFSGQNQVEIERDAAKLFSFKIQEIRADYFSFETEITVVWDKLVANKKLSNIAIARLRDLLDKMGVRSSLGNVQYDENNISKRKLVYQEIENSEEYLVYLGTILSFVREEHHNNSKTCLFIIVDNLDKQSAILQRTVQKILEILMMHAKITSVVALRQSTYYDAMAHGYRTPHFEKIQHCGPSFCEVISQRLMLLKTELDDSLENISVTEQEKQNLINNIDKIKAYLDHKLVSKFYESTCGHSIRKALELSRRLLSNAVYNVFMKEIPYKTSLDKSMAPGDIVRALLIGTNDRYICLQDQIIENIYNVNESGLVDGRYLVKLRTLRALASKTEDRGLEIGYIVRLLGAFGYDRTLIRYAFNDMLLESKRLIWSDNILYYKDDDDLHKVHNSSLYLTSAGYNYQLFLYNNPAYLQEVLLDIDVLEDELGQKWNYALFEDRMDLLLWFIKKLIYIDVNETKQFVSFVSKKIYLDTWSSADLITSNILDGFYNTVSHIIKTMRDKHPGTQYKSDLLSIKRKLDIEYTDLSSYLKYHRKDLLL